MKRRIITLFALILITALWGYSETKTEVRYEPVDVHAVSGRQGVCAEEESYWVSGSGTLAKYDKDWKLIAENTKPFEGYALEVNHKGYSEEIHEVFVYDIVGK